jgi:hypothetical protein
VVTPASDATNGARAASGTATVGWRAMTARSAGSSARRGASAASGGAGGLDGFIGAWATVWVPGGTVELS